MCKWTWMLVLVLAGCDPAQITSGLQTGAALLPIITTDLNAACTSAGVLSQQAQAAGMVSEGQGLAKSVAKPCSKVGTRAAQAQALVDAVNTAAAGLLSAAGAAKINLPGLKGS